MIESELSEALRDLIQVEARMVADQPTGYDAVTRHEEERDRSMAAFLDALDSHITAAISGRRP